jgi:predicted porin
VRYRLAFIDDPLFGVPVRNFATNSSLPTQQHLVEFGGTWSPSDTFLLSASFGFNAGWHSSEVASFQEDDYPITFTAWYAPTYRWSISGGLAFYSNWIDQDITLGSKSNPTTLPWDYRARSNVVNIGTTYAWTKSLTVSGGLDLVHGSNRAQPPWGYADLAPLSDVVVDVARMSVGLDYHLRPGMDSYLRYQLFDYEDKSEDYNSGTVNFLLGGFNVVY